MSRPTVAIAHDYLTQRGGAERVVLTLMKAFPEAAVHTTLYDPDATYPKFAGADVRTSPLNRVGALRRDHRLALPLLASAASRMRIDADVVIASSSGWAHGFDTSGRTVVYCHNPARWLYQTDEYLGGTAWRSPLGPPVLALRPFPQAVGPPPGRRGRRLPRQQSRRAEADRHDVRPRRRAVAAPARDGRRRSARGHPRPGRLGTRLRPRRVPAAPLQERRHRDRGRPGHRRRLVVVGRGPEEARLPRPCPRSLASPRWAQPRRAGGGVRQGELLVAASHQECGLAAARATASSMKRYRRSTCTGGFLETVVEGETGVFFDRPTPEDIAAALAASDTHAWDGDRLRARAEEFGEGRFIERIRSIVLDAGRST